MEDNLRALKNYQYQLKAIDKDTRMKIEDKNSQASQIYDGIINLIKDQQKELFLKRTASDIDARNKAKDGINAANLDMVDHEARRAKDNIDQYNSAKTTGLTEMTKSSFRNKVMLKKDLKLGHSLNIKHLTVMYKKLEKHLIRYVVKVKEPFKVELILWLVKKMTL